MGPRRRASHRPGRDPDDPRQDRPTTFGHLVDLHVQDMLEVGKAPRRTKAASLDALKIKLGKTGLRDLSRDRLIQFGKERAKEGAGPVTTGMDLGYIKTILTHAAAVHGVAVSPEPVDLARVALKRLGLVGKGRERDRRPTQAELDKLYDYFDANPRQIIPLARIVRFAIATAMRQDEICRIAWKDVDQEHRTVVVRDRKDPRDKAGNDQKVPLLDATGLDAWALLEEQKPFSNRMGRIFPYNGRSVGTAFRRACRELGIEELHFHDLRHEGTSRLFEAGFDIPKVALVTGHKDWKMLRRYTNLRPEHLKLVEFVPRRQKMSLAKGESSNSAVFQAAMELVVEDPSLDGAPRFRGTQIGVYPIADLLAGGAPEEMLLAEFPRLSPEMLTAARIYMAVRPRGAIGRPIASGPARVRVASG